MTVHELIEVLKLYPSDKKVMLRHTDHTDWTYKVDLVETDIDEDEYWDEDNSNNELSYEEEVERVVMIDCMFW